MLPAHSVGGILTPLRNEACPFQKKLQFFRWNGREKPAEAIPVGFGIYGWIRQGNGNKQTAAGSQDAPECKSRVNPRSGEFWAIRIRGVPHAAGLDFTKRLTWQMLENSGTENAIVGIVGAGG